MWETLCSISTTKERRKEKCKDKISQFTKWLGIPMWEVFASSPAFNKHAINCFFIREWGATFLVSSVLQSVVLFFLIPIQYFLNHVNIFFPNKKVPESCSEQDHSPQLLTLKIFLLRVCSTCPNPWNYFLIHAECCQSTSYYKKWRFSSLTNPAVPPPSACNYHDPCIYFMVYLYCCGYANIHPLKNKEWRVHTSSPLSLNFPFVFISF